MNVSNISNIVTWTNKPAATRGNPFPYFSHFRILLPDQGNLNHAHHCRITYNTAGQPNLKTNQSCSHQSATACSRSPKSHADQTHLGSGRGTPKLATATNVTNLPLIYLRWAFLVLEFPFSWHSSCCFSPNWLWVVEKLHLPTTTCFITLRITVVDNQPIGDGLITHQTAPITLNNGLFHREGISLFITWAPLNSIILGLPWLQDHDPTIYWAYKELIKWSPKCLCHCFQGPPTSSLFHYYSNSQGISGSHVHPNYHLIISGTAPLISFRTPLCPRAGFTLSQHQKPRHLKNMSRDRSCFITKTWNPGKTLPTCILLLKTQQKQTTSWGIGNSSPSRRCSASRDTGWKGHSIHFKFWWTTRTWNI